MKSITNRPILLFFLFILIIPLLAFTLMNWYENNVGALPYYHNGTATERAGIKHFSVPQFVFVNQEGIPLTNRFVKEKVWVVNYFFTSCPTICPKMMAGLKLVQQAFTNDGQIRIVSLTVDPFHDNPARLKSYAEKKNINLNQWQLGTGNQVDLYRFARKGLFITANDGDGGVNDFIHSDKIVLIDRNNHIRGYYDGTDKDEIIKLIKDIGRLKANPDDK